MMDWQQTYGTLRSGQREPYKILHIGKKGFPWWGTLFLKLSFLIKMNG